MVLLVKDLRLWKIIFEGRKGIIGIDGGGQLDFDFVGVDTSYITPDGYLKFATNGNKFGSSECNEASQIPACYLMWRHCLGIGIVHFNLVFPYTGLFLPMITSLAQLTCNVFQNK